MSEPVEPELIKCAMSGGFGDWLAAANGTLVVSTYQAGKVVLAGFDGRQVSVLMRTFPRPMGLAAAGQQIWLATQDEVVVLANAGALAPDFTVGDKRGLYDALFLPRVRFCTGLLDAHDLALGSDGPWIVATRFNSLVRLSDRFNFVPVWRAPFVSADGAGDRCHLNGLAMIDGKPAYVTALGTTDEPGGWRADKLTGGVLVSVADKSVRLSGLCMPHSPRWHQGALWLLNSGRGELWKVDPAKGTHEVVCALPGYTRGLSFVGPYALIGMSMVREKHLFGGVPVLEQFGELKCGAAVVDIRSGPERGGIGIHGGLPGGVRGGVATGLSPADAAQFGAIPAIWKRCQRRNLAGGYSGRNRQRKVKQATVGTFPRRMANENWPNGQIDHEPNISM